MKITVASIVTANIVEVEGKTREGRFRRVRKEVVG